MIVRRAALAVAVVVALLATGEIALRAAGLGDPPLFQKDPEIGYLLAANQEVRRLGRRIAINRYHQRSEQLSPEPPPGTERILFIGDSITFGVATVDQSETFPERVAELMRRSGRPAEAASASAASWAIGNARAYVERFGAFGSDVTVLQIGSADLLQPTSTDEHVGADPYQPDRKPPAAIAEVLTRYVLPRLRTVLAPPDLSDREPVTPAAREAQFDENMHHFEALVAALRAQDTRPVVLFVPGLAELAPPGERFTRYEPYRARFATIVDSLSLPLVDLAAEWEGTPGLAAYYTDGTHLTAEGNRAVAESLFRKLEALE